MCPLLRVTAGDVLRVEVDKHLPVEASVHWHGIALRNDMDGAPGMTQDPSSAGGWFRYEFTAPDPGTYFYHPHSGVQLDRGGSGGMGGMDHASMSSMDHGSMRGMGGTMGGGHAAPPPRWRR